MGEELSAAASDPDRATPDLGQSSRGSVALEARGLNFGDKVKGISFQLRKGDHLYLFSDGYADQFGGPDDKKFKYKAFRQMLVENSGKPMKEQLKVLTETLSKWMGGPGQVDDIVVLGLKIWLDQLSSGSFILKR